MQDILVLTDEELSVACGGQGPGGHGTGGGKGTGGGNGQGDGLVWLRNLAGDVAGAVKSILGSIF